jgi:hypothetical protein
LIGKVKFMAGAQDQVPVALLLESPNNGGSHHSKMTSYINPRHAVHG